MSGPIDFLRSRMDRMRNHPFQAGAGAIAGLLGGPIAGQLASRGFDMYNSHQFGNAASQANQNLSDQIGETGQSIWDRPLNGALGQFDGSGSGSGDNGPLAQAMGGNGAGGYNGPTQQPFAGNYGNNYGQGMQSSTPWTQPGNPGGLLDFLGPDPSQQGMQGEHRTHQEIVDDIQNQNGGGLGMPALYGVSNMQANGQNVINGMRPAGYDPNGAVVWHRTPGE